MKRTLVLYLVLVWILAACSNPTAVPATAAPSGSPEPVPASATPAPSAEPTNTAVPVPQLDTFPPVDCCSGRTIEAGSYSLPGWLGIPLSVEVTEGWRVINEEAARLFLIGMGRNPFNDPSQLLVFIPAGEADPEAILTSIRNSPEISPQGEITEITIAGFPGLQFDAAAKPNPDYEGDPTADIPPGVQFLPAVERYFAEGFLWSTWTAEARLRFIVLSIGEQTLLIQMEAPPAEFETFTGMGGQVLESLEQGR